MAFDCSDYGWLSYLSCESRAAETFETRWPEAKRREDKDHGCDCERSLASINGDAPFSGLHAQDTGGVLTDS